MDTRTTVTQHFKQEWAGNARQDSFADAAVVAHWFNAALGTASYKRLLKLYEELATLQAGLTPLRELRKTLRANRTKKKSATPAPEYESQIATMEGLARRINKQLSRYSFRPTIGYSVLTDTRAAGLTPDKVKDGYRLRLPRWQFSEASPIMPAGTRMLDVSYRELSEADAAIALVHLFITGELLRRVRLCEQCKKRWVVKAKSHYKFCSANCRDQYFIHSPSYHERKRANQKRYRLGLKTAKAANLA